MARGKKARLYSRQVAVALGYDERRDRAPRLAAKGAGWTARRIVDVARRHGVPVEEDGDLAAVLSHLDPGEEVPPRLYRVVAEILAYVYRVARASRPGT